jgi:L-ribulokinase
MHAAVAAGVYPTIQAAAEKMASPTNEIVQPIPENTAIYDQLYAEYVTLHDYFGRGENDVMKRLKKLRNQVRGVSA